jgi:hypothetical protein
LDQRFVYEVVFLVTPDLQQTLEGVTLILCNEDDERDKDFRGRAKVGSMMRLLSKTAVGGLFTLVGLV